MSLQRTRLTGLRVPSLRERILYAGENAWETRAELASVMVGAAATVLVEATTPGVNWWRVIALGVGPPFAVLLSRFLWHLWISPAAILVAEYDELGRAYENEREENEQLRRRLARFENRRWNANVRNDISRLVAEGENVETQVVTGQLYGAGPPLDIRVDHWVKRVNHIVASQLPPQHVVRLYGPHDVSFLGPVPDGMPPENYGLWGTVRPLLSILDRILSDLPVVDIPAPIDDG
jgi:hypothetical protein